jgi:hypothetical protein
MTSTGTGLSGMPAPCPRPGLLRIIGRCGHHRGGCRVHVCRSREAPTRLNLRPSAAALPALLRTSASHRPARLCSAPVRTVPGEPVDGKGCCPGRRGDAVHAGVTPRLPRAPGFCRRCASRDCPEPVPRSRNPMASGDDRDTKTHPLRAIPNTDAPMVRYEPSGIRLPRPKMTTASTCASTGRFWSSANG